MKFASPKPVPDHAEFGFPPDMVAAGKKLLEIGAVKKFEIIAPKRSFEVLVEDVFTYRVEVLLTRGQPTAKCRCSYYGTCGHRYAAIKYLDEQGIFDQEGAPRERANFLSQWYAVSVKKPDSILQKKLERMDELHERALKEGRLQEAEITQFSGTFSTFRYVQLHELGPIESPKEFCQTFAKFLEINGYRVPDFLRAAVSPAKVQTIPAPAENFESVRNWRHRLSVVPQSASIQPASLEFQIQVHHHGFDVFYRTNSELAFKKGSSHRTQEIFEGLTSGKYHFGPEAQIMWDLLIPLVENYRWGEFQWAYPASTMAVFNRLLRRPELKSSICSENGRPLERPEGAVRFEAKLQGSNYDLKLVQPNGEPVKEVIRIFPGRPCLFLTHQAVFHGPAIPPFMMDQREWKIPRSAVECSEGVLAFETLGIPLPADLEKRVVRVPSKLSLHGSLLQAGDNEYFALRIKFSSVDGEIEEAYTGEWVSYNPPRFIGPKSDTVKVFDSSLKSLVIGIVKSFDLKWNPYSSIWQKKVTKNFPDRFIDWRASLPKEVDLHLDPFFQTLIADPVSAQVELNCKETGIDWFDLNVELKISDTKLTKEEIKMLLNAKGGFVRLGDRGYMRIQLELSQEEQDAMAKLGLSPTDFSAEPQRLHALQLGDKAANRLLPEEHAAKIERRIDEIKTRVSPEMPSSITATMRPYQLEGFHFLAYLAENNFGGILADDMGLGKTIQTLAWLAWLNERPVTEKTPPKKPSLVVCPKSVMDNWQNETAKFLPSIKARVCQGIEARDLSKIYSESDLLVLNYAQLRNFSEELDKLDFLAVILDEGQYIKNPGSQTAQAARMLRSSYRLILSGTPIENRLLDLWSLMNFAMPGVLGNQAYFIRLFNEKTDSLARKRLAARVRPFLLRRTKNQVAQDLPDRIEEDLFCEMEARQKKLYKAELKHARMMLLGIQTTKQLQEQRFNFLTSLLRLRQICCHPLLIDPKFPKDESAKLGAFMDVIEPLIEEGQKVLVFSQFVTMLDILRKEFEERKWTYYYLAGETENRGALVDKFQKHEGAATFLISLKAGGFGLNLTAASYVVLFDPWWNPAVENQAIDRTHRIGQKNKVIAYRLLIKGSIEEKIRLLQKQKSSMAEGVLGDESFNQQLSLQDFQYLFTDDE